MLLDVDDYRRMLDRPVPERDGPAIVAVDLGGGRVWSAATALWHNGRIEALAVAPGVPPIEEQEQRDRVPRGSYERLVDTGRLRIAEGLRVQPVSTLWDAIRAEWGNPVLVVCDRFRLPELEDAINGACRIEGRVTRWSEAGADIRALRKHAADGPFAIEDESRYLMALSLSKAIVQNDDQGNTRLVKSGVNNASRDDVAVSLTLASGAFVRYPGQSPETPRAAPRLVSVY